MSTVLEKLVVHQLVKTDSPPFMEPQG